MRQLRFPPWETKPIHILEKLLQERDAKVKVNYHFCGRKL
jgi:hypothetical protein